MESSTPSELESLDPPAMDFAPRTPSLRPFTFLGLALALCGILLNQWTLAWLFHRTHFNNPLIIGAIWAIDVGLVAWGFLLPRSVFARTLLFALLPAVVLYVALEGLFTLIIDRHEPAWFRERRIYWSKFLPDERLGIRLRPNLKQFHYSWNNGENETTLDTDAFGFRNAAWINYDRARVFFIGDSFVFGEGSPREESAVGLIERELGEPVVNLGLSGFDLTQYEELFRQYTEQFHPKVVAIGIFANDLRTPIPPAEFAAMQKEMLLRYGTYSLYSRSLAFKFAKAYEDFRSAPKVATASVGVHFSGAQFGPDPRYFEKQGDRDVAAALNRIFDLAEARHVRPVLFLFPAKESTYRSDFVRLYPELKGVAAFGDEPYRHIMAVAEQRGVTVADLTPGFRAESNRVLYFVNDAHWNKDGQALAAQIMTPIIQKELAGSPGIRSRPLTNEMLNITSRVETTLRDLAYLLIRLSRKVGRLEAVFQPMDAGLVTRRWASPTKARERLGFVATTPLEEGMRRVIAWRVEAKVTRSAGVS